MNHGYEMYSTGTRVNNNIISLVTHGIQTYGGDPFVMNRNIKSLGCAPKTNIVLQVEPHWELPINFHLIFVARIIIVLHYPVIRNLMVSSLLIFSRCNKLLQTWQLKMAPIYSPLILKAESPEIHFTGIKLRLQLGWFPFWKLQTDPCDYSRPTQIVHDNFSILKPFI